MKTRTLSPARYPSPCCRPYRAGSRKDGGVGGAICPRCHVFIRPNSRVVRLRRPERPNTRDGRRDARTGQCYTFDCARINMYPRWWVHERCWEAGL